MAIFKCKKCDIIFNIKSANKNGKCPECGKYSGITQQKCKKCKKLFYAYNRNFCWTCQPAKTNITNSQSLKLPEWCQHKDKMIQNVAQSEFYVGNQELAKQIIKCSTYEDACKFRTAYYNGETNVRVSSITVVCPEL